MNCGEAHFRDAEHISEPVGISSLQTLSGKQVRGDMESNAVGDGRRIAFSRSEDYVASLSLSRFSCFT